MNIAAYAEHNLRPENGRKQRTQNVLLKYNHMTGDKKEMDYRSQRLEDIMREYYIQGKEGIPLNGLEDLPDRPTDGELTGIAVIAISEYLKSHTVSPQRITALIKYHSLCINYFLKGRAARRDSK